MSRLPTPSAPTLLCALALLAPTAARAATYTAVDAPTLDAAVASAVSGDTITFGAVPSGVIKLDHTLSPAGGVTLAGPGAARLALDGGGNFQLFLVRSGRSVALSGLTLQNGNGASGGACDDFGALTAANCAFVNNSADVGGALSSQGGTLTLTGCTFTRNSAGDGGALDNDNGGALTATGCTFTGNSADGDGGAVNNQSGTASLTACALVGNSATFDGGALRNVGTALALTGCTLTGNSSTGGGLGGGLYNGGGMATLTDDVLYGDSAAGGGEVYLYAGGVGAAYCDIQGAAGTAFPGAGNRNADPRFVTPYTTATASTNLHVQPGSACIGAGVLQPNNAQDITGAARADPPTLGAYEYLSGGVTTISGTVTLQGWLGTGEPTPALTFTLTPAGAATGGATQTLNPAPTAIAGVYAFTLTGVVPGAYTLGAKGLLWLRVDLPVNTTGGSALGANVSLPVGDVNGDNVVDALDLGLLRGDFGTVSGPNFNAAADLNGDGVVDALDLGLLRGNFGKVGADF